MFSRGEVLFPTTEAIQLFRVGLCQLTQNESERWDDLCTIEDGWEMDCEMVEETEEEFCIDQEIRELRIGEPAQSNDLVENTSDQVSVSSDDSQLYNTVERYESRGLRCKLAEPWVRRALMHYFNLEKVKSVYTQYLSSLVSEPTLTAAARGSLLDWAIMANIQKHWTDRPLQSILKDSGLFKRLTLPWWLTKMLKVDSFQEIRDESTASARDDTTVAFLSGNYRAIGLLPSTFAGPDGICTTSTSGVFLIFASALTTKGAISQSKYKKNIKTTDIATFYTKGDGTLYDVAKSLPCSLRDRHESAQKLLRENNIKGTLRIHLHLPTVAGEVPACTTLKQDFKTDLILNVDLKSATRLQLLDKDVANVLCNLCKGCNAKTDFSKFEF
jgi:hypothetical protein